MPGALRGGRSTHSTSKPPWSSPALDLVQSKLLPCAVCISQCAALCDRHLMTKHDLLCRANSGKCSGIMMAHSLFSNYLKIITVLIFHSFSMPKSPGLDECIETCIILLLEVKMRVISIGKNIYCQYKLLLCYRNIIYHWEGSFNMPRKWCIKQNLNIGKFCNIVLAFLVFRRSLRNWRFPTGFKILYYLL